MPDESYSLRFNDDLRRIREERGISVEALHEETKIPLGLLRQFEENGLFDHPMFNRVYLRSLVRAYAEQVNIDQDDALEHLDEALDGRYAGGLATAYLGEAPDEPEEPEEAAEEEPAEEEPAEEEPAEEEPAEDARAEAAAPDEAEAVAAEEAEPAEPEPEPDVEAAPPPSTSRREVLRRPIEDREAATPGSPAWADQSPPPPLRSRPPVDTRARAVTTQWLVIGLGVVVLAGVIWGVFALIGSGGSDDDDEAARAAALQDSVQVVDTTATAPPRPQIVLGDTLDLVIIASEGPVQGIRIKRDEDLRRPYWIEQGEAKAFPALNRIVIDNTPPGVLDDIRLVLEDYEYPTSQRDAQDRVIITREGAQAWADTLTGEPIDLPRELDTIRKGAIADQ